MNNYKKIITLSISFLVGFGMNAQPALAKAHKKTTKATAKKKSTVADILSRYSNKDRGGSAQINKFTQIIPSTAMPQTKTIRNVKTIKPPSSSQFFVKGNEKEDQVEKILDKQIDELYSLSQKFRKSPERGEIWLRLGELYVEKAKTIQFRLQSELDEKIARWEQNGKKGQTPKVNMNSPLVYNKKAIELYNWYINDFPKSKKLDQAYFFLGYNYIEVGDFKKGVSYYEKLAKDYPRSSYITESHFALGEFYFENNSWKKASENYQKALKNKTSRIYPFALYKLAWTQYRLGRPAVAIRSMEDVIRLARQGEQKSNEGKSVNKIRLGEEAFNDLILFYPDGKDYKSAQSYFEKWGGEESLYSSMEKLGYNYSNRGQRDAARYILGQLIDMEPDNPKNFDLQYQIVQNYLAGGDQNIFRKELFYWITEYGEDSAWGRANPKEKSRSYDLRESTLRSLTMREHKALQKSRNPNGQKQTKNLYTLYINNFKDSKNIAEMRFFYGELLYDMKKFDEASVQYKWVIQNAPESQYASSATLNEILSLEKSLPSEKELEQLRGEGLEPFALNSEEQAFISAGENYTQKFPKGEKSLEIRFKMGRILYSHNEFDKSLAIFKDIVAKNPKTQYAVFSANLILDIYNLRKDYEGLTQAGQELLSTPGLKSADVNMDIQNVVEKAKFKEAQDLEMAKDYAGSAKSYENFSIKNPKSSLAPIAKFNSGVNYERVGDLGKALTMYAGFLAYKGVNDDKHRKEARRLTGRIYEKTGQLKKAAEEFELFAVENPKDSLAPDMYYNAAIIWTGFRNYNRAIQDYEKYHDSSKKLTRVDSIYHIGDIYEKKGALSSANAYFERYINSNPQDLGLVISAAYRISKNARKARNIKKADEWDKKIIALEKKAKGDIGVKESAEAQFEQTLKILDELKAVRIPLDPKKQGQAIQQKLALVNKLNAELGKIIRLDVGDFVVASLTVAGQAYDHMSQSLYSAPKPKGLSAEDLKVYMAEVEKVAGPLKQQAIDNFDNAVKKSNQIDVYNNWTGVAWQSLNQLRGKKILDGNIIESYQISEAKDLVKGKSNKVDKPLLMERIKNAIYKNDESELLDAGQEILTYLPEDTDALNGYAEFYFKRGDLGISKIFLQKVIANDAKNVEANNNLGVIAMKEGKEWEAQSYFKKSISGDSGNIEANFNLGTFYLKYFDYSKASSLIGKSYSENKSDLSIANNYGLALTGQGEYDRAIKVYDGIDSKRQNAKILLNKAILLAEYKKDFKEAREIINKIRFISTEPAIIKRVNALVQEIDQQDKK